MAGKCRWDFDAAGRLALELGLVHFSNGRVEPNQVVELGAVAGYVGQRD